MRILEPSRKRKNSHPAGEEHGRDISVRGKIANPAFRCFFPGRDETRVRSPLSPPSVSRWTGRDRREYSVRSSTRPRSPLHTPAIVHCSPLARRPKERTHHYDSRRRRRQRRRSPWSSSPETDEQPFSTEVDEGQPRARARARASDRRGGSRAGRLTASTLSASRGFYPCHG